MTGDSASGAQTPLTPTPHTMPDVLCMNACDFTNICLNEPQLPHTHAHTRALFSPQTCDWLAYKKKRKGKSRWNCKSPDVMRNVLLSSCASVMKQSLWLFYRSEVFKKLQECITLHNEQMLWQQAHALCIKNYFSFDCRRWFIETSLAYNRNGFRMCFCCVISIINNRGRQHIVYALYS